MKKILFAISFALIVATLAVTVSATATLQFDIEETTTDDGQPVNVIVATLTDDVGDFRAIKMDFTFDNNIIVPVDYMDGSVPDYNDEEGAAYPFAFGSYKTGRTTTEITIIDGPNWVMNGENSTLGFEAYWSQLEKYPIDCTEGFVLFELYFKFADGKTKDDFTPNSFKPTYVKHVGGEYFHFIGNTEDPSSNDIVLTNNVVPEATVITIPVTAGDIVYLQDGTKVNIAETNAAYELTADVGYVAVNTGITAQKTYYVDGTKATLVHENGVLASDKINLRDRTETFGGEDRSGLRFAEMGHNPLSRNVSGHEVTEVGVLMTTESNKVLTAIGSADNLTYDMVGDYVKSGYAYGEGYDRFVDTTVDDLYLFSAVMYNIPINTKNVQTNIVCRPYYKVGDTYIYGETKKATLYDIATELQNSEDYEYLSDGQKEYIQEIIDCVNTGTDIEEGDIIIDIGGLYTPK